MLVSRAADQLIWRGHAALAPRALQNIVSPVLLHAVQKKAELAELQKAAAAAEKSEKPASSEATAAAPVAATEPEAKPEGAAPEATAAEAASRKGAATTEACNDEEKPAEEEADEKKELEEEIKDMEGVLEELQERSKDLVAQKQQVSSFSTFETPLGVLQNKHLKKCWPILLAFLDTGHPREIEFDPENS